MKKTRQILRKGEENYIFRHRLGDEYNIIDEFAKLAGDQNFNFDWFDAALLSWQMGRLENIVEKRLT